MTTTPIEDFGTGIKLRVKDLTNDEYLACCEFTAIMKFMREQSAPVPESNDELAALLNAWIRDKRREERREIERRRRLG